MKLNLLCGIPALLIPYAPMACSPSRAAAPTAVEGASIPDAGEPGLDAATAGRRFLLASSGVQFVTGADTGLRITPADLAQDVDVVAIHQEFYGIPWEAFEVGTPSGSPAWQCRNPVLMSRLNSLPRFDRAVNVRPAHQVHIQ